MTHFCAHTHARYRHYISTTPNGSSTVDLPKTAAEGNPTHQEIAELDYYYWDARGRQGGSPWEDWFRAERELRSRRIRQG